MKFLKHAAVAALIATAFGLGPVIAQAAQATTTVTVLAQTNTNPAAPDLAPPPGPPRTPPTRPPRVPPSRS